ncbi:MAG TPA: AAA family ATPase [Burkholderiaceae bacterium]|nr:AAA family ATPase [Burkholderiaceae bacterium]
MQLLEREAQLAQLTTLFEAAARGQGACALVLGEAGIGKTALVRRFAQTLPGAADVLWGGCEALFTPRPLGPIVDMAGALPPGLAALVNEGHTYNGLFPALLAYLRERIRPTLLVIEDAHWADEATLDCIKYLGRRIDRTPTLFVITARNDELELDHPLRRVLGDLPATSTRRIELAPLSRAAIDQMAHSSGRNAGLLQRLSGGNPFFLAELLATDGAQIPGSVRDAVLARVARLSEGARRVVELLAIEPARLERTLVADCVSDPTQADAAINEALACGVIRFDADWLAYRHEIARRSVEAALGTRPRIALHAQVLERLRGRPDHDKTLARQVHHAHEAGLRDQVALLAPQAAAQAARVGAHREAAALYRLAIANEDERGAAPALLEDAARELQLVNALEEAIELRQRALRLRRQDDRHDDNAQRIGVNLRLLAILHAQVGGQRNEFARCACEAVEAMEPLGPSGELAKAYATQSYVHYLQSEYDAAIAWGERAAEMAERFDDPAARVLALNRLGSARICRVDDADARAQVERALALAIEHRFEGLAADIFVSLQTLALNHHDHQYALDVGARGIAYCEARDLDGAVSRLLSRRAHSLLQLGRWDEGEREYAACLAVPSVTSTVRDSVHFVLHRQAARRGHAIQLGAAKRVPDAPAGTATLAAIDAFWRAAQTQLHDMEIEFRPPGIAAACVETAWLRGDLDAAVEVARIGLDEAMRTNDGRLAGPLLVWLHRLGAEVPHFEGVLLAAYTIELSGDRAGAAEAWKQLQLPFEEALVLAFGDASQTRAARALFDRLGAQRAAQIARARLHAMGVATGPLQTGPRRSTREHPHGLTLREREVFKLVADGLSNEAIARRLHRSERTVEHHVSAVLGKLGVKSRTELIALLAREALAQS